MFLGPPQTMHPLGFAVTYGYRGRYSDNWQGFSITRQTDPNHFHAGFARNDEMTAGAVPLAMALPRTFTLEGSYKRRSLTCSLNGVEILRGDPVAGPHPPYNRFGICCASLASGESVRLISLKFRRASN